ncbi:MAG: hypothetical protein OEV08_10930 [Nitrospira sp.]|nr:hypothetical protein [Nitrospira sp.]
MTLDHAIMHSASRNPKRGIQSLALLLVSALCMVLATGCLAKREPPVVIGLKSVAPLGAESEVDQLPTFRWEQFPREKDRQELDPRGNRIAAVSYEFRLWKAGARYSLEDVPRHRRGALWVGEAYDYKYSWDHECRDTDPGELVLSKKGLLTPQYHVEIPLEPDSYYFWSVRAHFTLDGKRRATEWSEYIVDAVLIDDRVLIDLHPDRELGVLRSNGCSYKATFRLIHTRPKNPLGR